MIKRITFPVNRIEILLDNGVELSFPLSAFPEIQRMKPAQRKQHHILFDDDHGQAIVFNHSDKVFMAEDFFTALKKAS